MAADRPTYTLEEWQAELAKRGKVDCKFRCPFCGNEASPADWQRASGDPQRAPRECIGRLIGAKGGLNRGREQPCDWAAFGLFGTLNEGTKIRVPRPPHRHPPEASEYRDFWVFDFAEVVDD